MIHSPGLPADPRARGCPIAGPAWCLAMFAMLAAGSPAAAQALPAPTAAQPVSTAVTWPGDAGAASVAQALALTQQNLQVPEGARVEIVPGSLDARLRLAPCAHIEPHLPAGTRLWGPTRVGLRCVSGPVRWNVYLPMTVHLWAPALVSAGPLAAGSTLTADDLRLAEVDLAASPARSYHHAGELIGRTLAVALPAGATLRADALRQRQWFQAGEMVTVVARGPGYAVSGEAQALSNGVEGQPARLRTDNGRVITAMPVGTRRVEIAL